LSCRIIPFRRAKRADAIRPLLPNEFDAAIMAAVARVPNDRPLHYRGAIISRVEHPDCWTVDYPVLGRNYRIFVQPASKPVNRAGDCPGYVSLAMRRVKFDGDHCMGGEVFSNALAAEWIREHLILLAEESSP
jgi:hypothetical protein